MVPNRKMNQRINKAVTEAINNMFDGDNESDEWKPLSSEQIAHFLEENVSSIIDRPLIPMRNFIEFEVSDDYYVTIQFNLIPNTRVKPATDPYLNQYNDWEPGDDEEIEEVDTPDIEDLYVELNYEPIDDAGDVIWGTLVDLIGNGVIKVDYYKAPDDSPIVY